MPEEEEIELIQPNCEFPTLNFWVSLCARIILIKRTGMDRSIKPYFLPVFGELELLQGSP